MKKHLRKITIILCFLLGILCCIIITLSPRFGYRLDGVDSNLKFKKCSYYLSELKSDGIYTIATYKNYENNFITLIYPSRFLGSLKVLTDNESYTITGINLDGSCRSEQSTISESDGRLAWSMYSIISNDSGAFFFFHYLKVIFFIILLLGLILWSYKLKSRKTITIFRCIAVITFLFTITLSFRII